MLVSMQHSYEIGRLEEETRTLAEEVALLRFAVENPDSVTRPEAE